MMTAYYNQTKARTIANNHEWGIAMISPIFKYDAVCIMEQSYAFFKAFFTDDSFMDFWNNCYGRSYPSKGYISGISAFSYSAFTAHELVLDGAVTLTDNLTEAHRYSIWSWDWYSY